MAAGTPRAARPTREAPNVVEAKGMASAGVRQMDLGMGRTYARNAADGVTSRQPWAEVEAAQVVEREEVPWSAVVNHPTHDPEAEF